MLRVCGITYDHTVNYGSCLQAYALQEAIDSIRLADGEECSYSLIPIRSFREWPARITFARLCLLPLISLHRTQFRRFEKSHMHFAKVQGLRELPLLNQENDAFVCGSDVIWNPDLNFQLDAFYLSFANKYRFSYAASFGKTDIDDQTIEKTRIHIDAFDAISLRERTGLEILKKITDKPARIACDPVLLMTKNEWEDELSIQKEKDKYIFVYITHLSQTVQGFLDMLKRKTGHKIIYAAYGPKQALTFHMLQVQTPEKWLGLLHDAEYVVTNSFHATAFSVLFHKKFFTVVNGDKAKGINVRMNDFLTALGLEDRIFSSMPEQLDLSEIDYTEADKRIEKMREESLAFLRENLEAAYRQKKELEQKAN